MTQELFSQTCLFGIWNQMAVVANKMQTGTWVGTYHIWQLALCSILGNNVYGQPANTTTAPREARLGE